MKTNFKKICSLCLMVLLIFLTACGGNTEMAMDELEMTIDELSFREFESSFQLKKVVYNEKENKVSFESVAQVDDTRVPAVLFDDGSAMYDGLILNNIETIRSKGEIEGILTYGDGYYAILKRDGENIAVKFDSEEKKAYEEIRFEELIDKAVVFIKANGDIVERKLKR